MTTLACPAPPLHARRRDGAAAIRLEPRLHAVQLVHHGAIMQTADSRVPPLVGELRWRSASMIAWFPAFGDRLEDARVFHFDRMVPEPGALKFFLGASVVATLSSIAIAGVDDPDDYRIGWQLWLEIVPLRRAFIDAAFEQVLGHAQCA